MLGMAGLAWWFVQSPIERMTAERQLLYRVAETGQQVQSQVSRLINDSFGQRKPEFDKAVADWDKAQSDTSGVILLPRISPAVAEAVEIIRNLNALTTPGIKKLQAAWPEIEDDAMRLLLNKSSATILKFFGEIPTTPDGKMDALAATHIAAFINILENLNRNYDAVIHTIAEQNLVIDAEMDQVRIRGAVLGIVFLVLIIGLTFFLSWRITRSISQSVHAIAASIHQMVEGNLTGSIHLSSHDELGKLGHGLDGLMGSLNSSISYIQKASAENATLHHKLNETVFVATSSSTEIEAGTRSIGMQMERLDTMLESTQQGLGQMASAMDGLNQRIEAQDKQVEMAGAAVGRMLDSIAIINQITDQDLEAAQNLVSEAESGRQVFAESFEQINLIAARIDQIQDMASVIAGIANQTNILAMNAAIESAHAGEFGKGFAVVADEITKLAAASAASSEEISRTIESIISLITNAANSSDHMSHSLDTISERIETASRSSHEIHRNIAQVQTENQQIQEAMDSLRHDSQAIRSESLVIDQALAEHNGIVENMNRISREVVSNITEITTGLSDISQAVHTVSDQAEHIGSISTGLNQAINRYRTGE